MVQLPAMNTPQFSWVKSRLPREPQPVPPIFQPEVAARAIVHAALHPRRELWVGMPTVKAVVGNAIVPDLLDRWLARTGYDAQQTDVPVDGTYRLDNLWLPVPGDHGAHGAFDDRARSGSVQLWLDTHRAMAAIGGALAIGGAALLLRALR